MLLDHVDLGSFSRKCGQSVGKFRGRVRLRHLEVDHASARDLDDHARRREAPGGRQTVVVRCTGWPEISVEKVGVVSPPSSTTPTLCWNEQSHGVAARDAPSAHLWREPRRPITRNDQNERRVTTAGGERYRHW